MNPLNLFKYLEKEKGRPIPIEIKLINGLPLTPQELNVKGNLDLSGTPIESLPQGLQVRGDLYLYGTSITSLPQGLKVGYLSLENTPIASLPKGLKVGRALNLWSTSIASLPPDLQVEENLWIEDTPLAKKSDEEIRAMLKTGYIKGIIYK